jgi:hypothetical protein
MTWVAVAVVGGSLLTGKIASNRGQKAAIGSGTAPALESGTPLDIAPVKGTEVLDFGAATEGFAEPEIDRVAQEQELIQQLIDAGYDPEELGIAGLAFGGPLYRRTGGGIPSLLDLQDLDLPLAEIYKLLHQGENIDPNSPLAGITEQQLIEAGHVPEDPLGEDFDPNDLPEVDTSSIEDPTLRAQMGEWWGELDPQLQSTIITTGGKVLSDVLFPPERQGSIVSTQTLPGNSARRRAAQINIKPIQGSVRNAAHGGVLDRQMFQPSQETYTGGPMNGPGGPKDDLIPVMASNGEYMLSKAAVDAAGDGSHAMGIAKLNRFNQMGNKRYG